MQGAKEVLDKEKKAEGLQIIAQLDGSNKKSTDTGLVYVVLQKGDGVSKPSGANMVELGYKGLLTDGTVFDSNPRTKFPINGLIPGFTQTIKDMKVGEKRIVKIPANLAYGERGAGGAIPPNSDIIFEIEIFNFLKINTKSPYHRI